MTGSHPPAWYEDPSDPTRVRRWNGNAWTNDVRPRPPWLRMVRLSPGPTPAPPAGGRRLWATSVAAFVLALVLFGALNRSTAVDPDRLARAGYAVAASHECATTKQDLKAIDPKLQGAGLVAARLLLMEPMVERIRRIDPSRDDRARVARWVGSWDLLLAEVREELDAYRAGDAKRVDAVFSTSRTTKTTVDRFSTVNGMFDCVF